MSSTEPQTKPMDASELKKCRFCNLGMMHAGSPVFYELTLTQCVVDVRNVQRMHGLEMMMGGAAPLARVFSPDNTVAHRIVPPSSHFVCSDCAISRTTTPLELMEEGD